MEDADSEEAAVAATKVSAALAVATCALLGTTAAPVLAQEDPGWSFDTSLLYYGEDDDRVQDFSASVLARWERAFDRTLTLGLTVDTLTGASPNGALPQAFVQTFTQPSGNATFDTPANTLPIDDTFKDTRYALTVDWEQPLGEQYLVAFGVSASTEYDYLHLGVNAKLARDFNKHNTTVSGGIAYARDEIDPEGGIPFGNSIMLDVGDLRNRGGPETKDIIDVMLGVTQVLTPNLLAQVNYSYSNASGYLSDPYKLVSFVDRITGEVITNPNPGASHIYFYEHRPDERTKHSLYTQAKYYMSGKVLAASYRFMTDDWGINSHTLDLRYRWPIGGAYIEPHFRYYKQTAADFYTLSVPNCICQLPWFTGFGTQTPLSADYRLGEFEAYTVGAKFGWTTGRGNEMNIRLEWYHQHEVTGTLIGNQVNQDNRPDLNAIIVQYGYRFGK